MPRTLMILDPGHFHAGLPLRSRHPLLADTVHVFGPDGPELERFLAQVARFNTRAEAPTAWQVVVHRSADPLADLLATRPGDVAVLAGRNRGKLARIAALVQAGIHVLADKPWVVEAGDARHLDGLATARAHAADLMTERYEPGAAMFAALARCPAVVGAPDGGRGPMLSKETIHHLSKQVDGVQLVRPAWYFDTRVQGEGVVDVTTHLVDQVLLISGAQDRPLSPGEVRLGSARRWTTPVPLADFTAITKLPAFPDDLAERVRDQVLQLSANGEIGFTCRGLSVRVQAEWRLRDADGVGDRHRSRFHGMAADVELDGTAASGSQLVVRPHRDHAAVGMALAAWAATRPGTLIDAEAGVFVVRPARWSSHDEHFALVLGGFLERLDGEQPAWERAALYARYRLLAEALAWC
jgi:predicted dehydrogenase